MARYLSNPAKRIPFVSVIVLIVGIVLLAFTAESSGQRYNIPWLTDVPIGLQFLFLIGGATFVGFGLSGGKIFSFRFSVFGSRNTQPHSVKPRGWEWGAWVAILLLGFTVRSWNLEQAVFMYVDELGSVYTLIAQHDVNTRLLVPSWEITGWSQVYAFVQSFGVETFGSNLTGLRAISVIVGLLTIPALYMLASELFDRRVGLLAALWLATFPPHIHFSRLGVPNIVDPLFGVLALGLLVRGWRRGKTRDYAFAGVMLGLTQYFYEAGRLMFPILAVGLSLALIITAWLGKNPSSLKPFEGNIWRGIVGLLRTSTAAVLVGTPAHYALLAAGISPAMRLNTVGVIDFYFNQLQTNPLDLLQSRILPPFLHYIALPDQSLLYYGGDYGLVLPYMVPFFLLGVGIVLRRWWRPGLFLLLLWLVGVGLGNGFILQSVFSSRYAVVLPALVVCIALGLRAVPNWWRDHPRRTLFDRLAGFVVVGLALLQVVYYFGIHLPLYNQQIRPFRDFGELVPRAQVFPLGTRIHLVTDDQFSVWQFDVLQRYYKVGFQFDVVSPADMNMTYLDSLPRDVPNAFFVIPEDSANIALIQSRFNVGEPQASPYNVPLNRQYFLLYVPAEGTSP